MFLCSVVGEDVRGLCLKNVVLWWGSNIIKWFVKVIEILSILVKITRD